MSSKNVIMEGVFGSEAIDSSGEVLSIKGADISALQSGQAVLNTEHVSPEDIAKGNDKDPQGFSTIVGRVITAKKIFDIKDCDTDKERDAYRKIKKPLIYGSIELYNTEDAHENAKAASALAKLFSKSDNGPRLGLSVEGATLKRKGHLLEETAIRRMALTLKPCNKTSWIDVSNKESSSNMFKGQNQGGVETLSKTVAMTYIDLKKDSHINGLAINLNNLRKALEAGGMNTVASSSNQGSSLQKESQLTKLVKFLGNKPTKEAIKKTIPELSDDEIQKVQESIKVLVLSRYKF